MRPGLFLFPLILLTGPALADPPDRILGPAEFEAIFTGHTFSYADQGVTWGIETYLPDGRVLWRAVGQDCKMGHWYAEGTAICFTYDDGTSGQCWQFIQRGRGGMEALFLNDPAAVPSAITQEPDSVACPGPEVGS